MSPASIESLAIILGAVFSGIGTGSPAIGFAVFFVAFALWQPK